jgi:signal transduction histidine kinase
MGASLMHLAMVFPRERAVLKSLPWLVFIPYGVAIVLTAVSARGIQGSPSFWALSERVMLAFAALGGALLAVNAFWALRESQSPLERARARALFVTCLGIPVIFGGMAFPWLNNVPGGHLTVFVAGIAVFAAPIGYSITRYELFDFPVQARAAVEGGLQLILVGVVSVACFALLDWALGIDGPIAWGSAGIVAYLAANRSRKTLHSLLRSKLTGSSMLRRGLIEAFRQDAPRQITDDATARLVGRAIESGLQCSGVAVFLPSDTSWRPAYAGPECPSISVRVAAAAARALGHEPVFDTARGDTSDAVSSDALHGAGVELVLAIRFEDELLGLVLAGPPRRTDAYRSDELVFAQTLCRHSGLAMFTARLASRRLAMEQNRELVRHATDLAHDVGRPLRVLERRARRIADRADRPNLVRSEIQKVDSVVQYLLRTVQEISILSDAEPSRGKCLAAPLEGVVDRALEALADYDRTERVILNFEPGLPRVSESDALTRVLVNLLDNAFAASAPDQSVSVYAGVTGGELSIEVRDAGCGMTLAEAERAFDLHYSTKAGGMNMGLGLTISREIVESMGGKLDLITQEGTGVAAIVRLPALQSGVAG